MHEEAASLNESIRQSSLVVYNLLSEKGRAIFFPKKGIIAQTAAAREARINATIGMAQHDGGKVMSLDSILQSLDFDAAESLPYAATAGLQELREAWKKSLLKKNRSLTGKSFSMPVVTSGLTHGLHLAGHLFMNKEDMIISPSLFWGNYRLTFEKNCGAKFDCFELFKKSCFNHEGLREKLLEPGAKKIVLLNFPHNPTGYSLSVDEAEEVVSVLREAAQHGKQIVALIDDAYFGFLYKPHLLQESLFGMLSDVHENVLAVKIDGASKEHYAWGLRVGFITFGIKGGSEALYHPLESKASGIIRGSISSTSRLSQSLVLRTLDDKETLDKERNHAVLQERYGEIKTILKDEKYASVFEALPFNSGYFMCVALKPEFDADVVRKKLLEEHGIGVISMPPLLRIAFSSVAKADIKSIFDAIYEICTQYK